MSAMDVNACNIVDWSNQNGGLVSLIGVLIAVILGIPVFHTWFRYIRPSIKERERRLSQERRQVLELKDQFAKYTEFDDTLQNYGEFILCDDMRKLRDTKQEHSKEFSPHRIVCLKEISTEYLLLTEGASGLYCIKKLADHWHYCEEDDEDAIRVEEVLELRFQEIARVRWESNPYWREPIICCRFNKWNEFPFNRRFYAERKELRGREFFSEVCLVSEVYPKQKTDR